MQVSVQVPAPPSPAPSPDVLVFAQPPWESLPPEAIVMIAMTAIVVSGLVLWPLMRALGRRIEGRGVKPADFAALEEEVGELKARLAEAEGGSPRLHEIEERLDFAERLLAERQPSRLRGDG